MSESRVSEHVAATAPSDGDMVELERRAKPGNKGAYSFRPAPISTGAHRSADRAEPVAKTHGDGPGFDIISITSDGRERLIQVKKTSLGSMNVRRGLRSESHRTRNLA